MNRQEKHLYEFGRFRLIPAERLLLLDGEPVALQPKAFETLVALVRRAGRLVEKTELLSEVWSGTVVEESNVAQNVFALRRVLGQGDDESEYIETVPKRGYRFVAPVRVVHDDGEQVSRLQHVVEAASDRPGTNASLLHSRRDPEPVLSPAGPEPDDSLPRLRPPSASPQTENALTQPPRRFRARGLVLMSIAAAVLVGTTFFATRRLGAPPDRPVASKTISLSRLLSGTWIPSAAISPDGRYVAHVVHADDESSIVVRQVSTVTDLPIIPLTRRTEYWGLTYSHDGDSLYYNAYTSAESRSTLYRISALGGVPRKVLTGIHSPVGLSPDGSQIVFVREVAPNASHVIIANADGTGERILGTRRTPDAFFSSSPRGGPSWSPDGRTIATGVISLVGGYHGEIVTLRVSDGVETRLGSHPWHQVAQVAWLPDGTGLLVAARESSAAQLWHVTYPGGETRRITADLNDYHGISLSADSTTLVTVQYDRRSTIEFAPGKPTNGQRRSTEGMDEGFYGLAFTPSGDLVYSSDASGNQDLWLLDAEGTTTRQLTTSPAHDSTPSVSPDGRSVVFISHRDGGNPHVWQMDVDGSHQRQLTNQRSEGTPSFTPDGQWVVYAEFDAGIWKVPAGRGAPVRVARGSVHTPSVSPDGRVAACFYSDDDPATADRIALISMTATDGEPIRLLDFPEGFSTATVRWTPDSKALVYVSTRDNVGNLWTLPLDGSAPTRLTSFGAEALFNFAYSRDQKQLAVARGPRTEHVVLIRNFR